jgi:hypothetical protein
MPFSSNPAGKTMHHLKVVPCKNINGMPNMTMIILKKTLLMAITFFYWLSLLFMLGSGFVAEGKAANIIVSIAFIVEFIGRIASISIKKPWISFMVFCADVLICYPELNEIIRIVARSGWPGLNPLVLIFPGSVALFWILYFFKQPVGKFNIGSSS